MKKKAFTLIEILIVLFIVGMLIGIMFKVYTTVAQIAFRVEQQKNVNQELLFMSEILQNFSNRNKIDYSKYGDDRSVDSRNNLVVNNGYTNVLYMTWEDGEFAIYSSGENCWSGFCDLYIFKNNSETRLTSNQTHISKAVFKVIPYENDWYAIVNCQTNQFACRNHQWFWFFVDIYSNMYNKEKWTNNIYMNVQQFFNN